MKKAFFVLFFLLFLGCSSNDASSVAINYTRALFEGDVSTAIKLLDIKNDKKKEEFTSKLKIISKDLEEDTKKRGGIKNIMIVDSHSNGDLINVKVQIIFNNNSSEIETIKLVKNDRFYKVKLF